MKTTLGALLMVAGVALGLYVGVWVLFVGGILNLVDVVNLLIDGAGLDGMLIVWGVLKMMFAGLVGTLSAYVLIIPGVAIFNKSLN